MSKCVIDYNGYLMTTSSGCDYVVLTPVELQTLQDSTTGSLSIDSELYSSVTGYLLLSLVGGHILGRIVKGLGRG
ncbi:hypothetical protein [Vibrio sp. ABG19]|uniref:hypothetical protein n=1 Tax=Vibrio sp. ABG19 TaxID=2817385 RepID=UPI00249E76F9|nr:hypothetical protein [Vibrio sp. ABG19]WGY45005.1 hypothetical protein J0X00_04690 [Vibrio sp. ABG19]